MRLEIIRAGHVEALVHGPMRPLDRTIWGAVDIAGQVSELVGRGPAFALVDGGRLVALAGVNLLRPGVGEAWCMSAALVEKRPLAFCRLVRQGLEEVIGRFDLHRIQAVVDERHTQSLRWVKWLGFEPEGLLQAFGSDKQDYLIMARLN